MSKYVNITVVTDNGAILEKPIVMSFLCSELHAVGQVDFNVRNYTISDCIEVKKVFGLRYGNDLYGTNDFSTVAEWNSFRNTNCVSCKNRARTCCPLTYNGCLVTYNGMVIFSENIH